MPRRGFVPKREVLDDPIYGGKLVTKLINQVMLDGKRGTAQKACYGAFYIIREKTGRDPLEVFQEAMNNVMPVLEVNARRIGGSTYQVPLEIRAERRQTLGKQVKTRAEEARVAVRNIRRDANEAAKKAQKASELTEDELKDMLEKIQKVTDKNIANIDVLMEEKEKELMAF